MKNLIIYGSTLCMFKWSLLCHLRKYDVLIQDQARELAQLRQTIEKGREVSVLLKQHLRSLLTHADPTNFQGQGFQEQLAEGCRPVERLARKLSPGKAVVCPDCTELLQEIPLTRIFFLTGGSGFHVPFGVITGPALSGWQQRGEMHWVQATVIQLDVSFLMDGESH